MRIIPAIDIMDGKVVRLYRGDPLKKTTYGDDPVATAMRWERQGAHMIHVVDLDAALSRGNNADIIRDVAGAVSIPVQAAGGLRSQGMVADTLEYASRAVVGTLALDGDTLGVLVRRYGERLVVAVDYVDGRVATHGWRQDSGLDVYAALERFMGYGATQFLLTDISRDGTMSGPDLETLSRACRIRGADVMASGGISSLDDIRAVCRHDPYGIILGRAIYLGTITIPEAVISCSPGG